MKLQSKGKNNWEEMMKIDCYIVRKVDGDINFAIAAKIYLVVHKLYTMLFGDKLFRTQENTKILTFGSRTTWHKYMMYWSKMKAKYRVR
jgi:hypothetical protein